MQNNTEYKQRKMAMSGSQGAGRKYILKALKMSVMKLYELCEFKGRMF